LVIAYANGEVEDVLRLIAAEPMEKYGCKK